MKLDDNGKQRFGKVADHIQNVHHILDQVGMDISTLKHRMAQLDTQQDELVTSNKESKNYTKAKKDKYSTLKKSSQTSAPSKSSSSAPTRTLPRFRSKLPPRSKLGSREPTQLSRHRELTGGQMKSTKDAKLNEETTQNLDQKVNSAKQKAPLRHRNMHDLSLPSDQKHADTFQTLIPKLKFPNQTKNELNSLNSLTRPESNSSFLNPNFKEQNSSSDEREKISGVLPRTDAACRGHQTINDSHSSLDAYFWEEESELKEEVPFPSFSNFYCCNIPHTSVANNELMGTEEKKENNGEDATVALSSEESPINKINQSDSMSRSNDLQKSFNPNEEVDEFFTISAFSTSFKEIKKAELKSTNSFLKDNFGRNDAASAFTSSDNKESIHHSSKPFYSITDFHPDENHLGNNTSNLSKEDDSTDFINMFSPGCSQIMKKSKIKNNEDKHSNAVENRIVSKFYDDIIADECYDLNQVFNDEYDDERLSNELYSEQIDANLDVLSSNPPSSSLSPWLWFQRCCDDVKFPPTHRHNGAPLLPSNVKVSEMVDSYNSKKNSCVTDPSLLQSKQLHIPTSKIKKLISAFEKQEKFRESGYELGFADSFLNDMIKKEDDEVLGKEEHKEIENINHVEIPSTVDESNLLVDQSMSLLSFNQKKLFNQKRSVENGKLSQRRSQIASKNIGRSVGLCNQPFNLKCIIEPNIHQCPCNGFIRLNQSLASLQNMLFSTEVDEMSSFLREVSQGIEYINISIKESSSKSTQFSFNENDLEYTNRTIERSSFFKHLMRKAARGVLSTGRGLYRFFSRFVVDTFYSMAVTTASIAILRFCIIEILMENDIEYESLLSNGIISFSRLPSYKNVH